MNLEHLYVFYSKIEKMLGEDSFRQNVTLGNRNNLLFVESCIDEIRSSERSKDSKDPK